MWLQWRWKWGTLKESDRLLELKKKSHQIFHFGWALQFHHSQIYDAKSPLLLLLVISVTATFFFLELVIILCILFTDLFELDSIWVDLILAINFVLILFWAVEARLHNFLHIIYCYIWNLDTKFNTCPFDISNSWKGQLDIHLTKEFLAACGWYFFICNFYVWGRV